MNPRFREGLRFHRTADAAFKTPRYGAAIEIPTRRPRLWVRIWRAIVRWL